MEFQADALRDHLIFLDRLGPPKKVVDEEFGLTMGRCACNKRVLLTEFEVLPTGLTAAVDNVCPGCRHHNKGKAIIVCPRCRAVIARLPAHKDKSGFEFKANRIYHVDCCAVCEYEMIAVRQEPTFILEMLHYFKQRNLLIPDQWKNRKYGKPLIIGSS